MAFWANVGTSSELGRLLASRKTKKRKKITTLKISQTAVQRSRLIILYITVFSI